jgi:hypothetical protein
MGGSEEGQLIKYVFADWHPPSPLLAGMCVIVGLHSRRRRRCVGSLGYRNRVYQDSTEMCEALTYLCMQKPTVVSNLNALLLKSAVAVRREIGVLPVVD